MKTDRSLYVPEECYVFVAILYQMPGSHITAAIVVSQHAIYFQVMDVIVDHDDRQSGGSEFQHHVFADPAQRDYPRYHAFLYAGWDPGLAVSLVIIMDDTVNIVFLCFILYAQLYAAEKVKRGLCALGYYDTQIPAFRSLFRDL